MTYSEFSKDIYLGINSCTEWWPLVTIGVIAYCTASYLNNAFDNILTLITKPSGQCYFY